MNTAFLLPLVFGLLAAEPETPVSAAEAVKRPGQTLLVEMRVQAAKDRVEKRGLIYLDSEDDFHRPGNLGVAITAAGKSKFKAKGIADPAAHFLGKTIRVRGEVLVFEERPYLPVTDPGQIQVIEPAK